MVRWFRLPHTTQTSVPERPRSRAPMARNDVLAQSGRPQQWWPRAGWGTVRNYRVENSESGKANLSFTFVPDDGTEPRLIQLADVIPLEGLGEYARGIIRGKDTTIRVSVQGMARAELEIFRKINQLELSKRQIMFANRSDIDGDCGWAWTSDYTLVKVAPGLLD